MKRLSFLVIAFAFATTPVLSQVGAPSPAPALASLEPLVGHWQGSGTAVMAPGAPPAEWTSLGTWKWILNGHFLQEEIRVEFPGGTVPTMIFRAFYGWNPSEKRLVSYGLGNTGEMKAATDVAWTDDRLIVIRTDVEDGVPRIQRTVMTLGADSCAFRMQIASGAKEFVTAVDGTLKRCEKGYAISDEALKEGVVPASEAMQKLHSICGSYVMKGKMVPVPGAPEVAISAHESVRPIFNGTIIEMHVLGDPLPNDTSGFRYEGLAYLGWNAKKECFDEIWVNNMGQTSLAEFRWVGDQNLVSTHASVQFGLPDATRATLELNEEGAIRKVSMDRMNSNHAVVRAFMGDYTKKGAARKIQQ